MVSACVETGGSYVNALAIMGLWLVVEAAWMWLLHRTTPPGRWRLLLSLPVIAGNLATPRMFCRHQDVIMIIFASFMTGWLTNYKILAWCLNRGVLAHEDYTALQFSAVLLTPITPAFSEESPAPADEPANGDKPSAVAAEPAGPTSAGDGSYEATAGRGVKHVPVTAKVPLAARRSRGGRRQAEATGGAAYMFALWIAKLVVLCTGVWLLSFNLHWFVKSIVCTFILYGLLSFLMDGPGAVITAFIGLEVSPHFDCPWLINSISSLWSKRWDLAAGNALRSLVFEPAIEGRLVYDKAHPPPPTQPTLLHLGLAILLTFAASGVVHEYIMWCMVGHTTYGVWLTFFLAQVPLQIAERIVFSWLRTRGMKVPNLLRIIYAVSTETVVVWAFFWIPVLRYGVLDEVVVSVNGSVRTMCGLLGLQTPAAWA